MQATPSPSPEQAAALDATIAELRLMGAIDAAAEEQLRSDLRQTDPALWPRLLQYFRASRARQTPEPKEIAGPAPPLPIDSVPPAVQSPPKSQVAGPAQTETKEPAPEKGLITRSVMATEVAGPPVPGSPAESPEELKPQPEAAVAAPPPAVSATPEPSASTEVQKASFEQPRPDVSWQDHLQAAIRELEKESSTPPKTAAEIARHADLRLLCLIAGRREDALRPIAGIPPAQQDFWAKEIYGLATYLDCDRITDSAQRAAAAKDHFSEAVARLGELGTLVVKNLAFCTKVSSYGVFTRFDSDTFTPGQEVLLYAEVENFRSDQTEQGHHTVLRNSYQVLDSRGQRVDQRDFSTTEEHCQNPRRDFFIVYSLYIPQRIYDGKYTLQFTIEDALSQKIGQSSIEFTVKGAQE